MKVFIQPMLRFLFVVIFGVFSLTPSAHADNQAPVIVTVDAASRMEGTQPRTGFLHGFSDVDYQPEALNMALLKPLKPAFWRIGFGANFGHNYRLAKTLNPDVKIALVLGDLLAVHHGGYDKMQPWRDWAGYEREVGAIVRWVRQEGYAIDYWDVWSEPDVQGYWSGSCDQVMEMFKRTHDVIRAALPQAKIIGPSISSFQSRGMCEKPFLATFVEYATANQLRFDALSWHEFDQPGTVPGHVAAVRQHYLAHPELGMPEIHINEYSEPSGHLVPGVAVTWLDQLEKSAVDWASRACWGRQCRAGLNGLFKDDNQTPNAIYWVYRSYADMPQHRLGWKAGSDRIAVIAGSDDTQGKLTLLIGGLPDQQHKHIRLSIRLTNLHDTPHVLAVVKRIPNQNHNNGLPRGPVVVSSNKLQVTHDEVLMHLSNVAPGDAFLVEVTRHKSTAKDRKP